MGRYKVPQNVEAEDTIIGPLTIKQFIYTIIGVGWGFASFMLFRQVPVLFIIAGVPVSLIFLMLGLYKRQDQPFEQIFVALVGFFVRPRKRVWEKEHIERVFEVEAPIPPPESITRDPEDVKGQLERLSKIVDTRGWSAKQPELQEPQSGIELGDRLVAPLITTSSNPVETTDVNLSDDILDFQNNPTAQNLNGLIENAVQNIRQEAQAKMLQHKSAPKQSAPITPAAAQMPATPTGGPSASVMITNPIGDILKLATEGDDLTVSQLSVHANRQLAEGQAVNLRDGQKANNPQKHPK